jgi:outer membrane receptor protein involved in Fe transport
MDSFSFRDVTMKSLCTIALTLLCCSQLAVAGNTGKIAGKVTDKENGSVLIGVNISIGGTRLGASTSTDGTYYIIGIAPGTYEVRASCVGYHPLKIKEVVVRVDLTTDLNIKLESDLIESSTVEVVAEREMVRKDITSTRKMVTSDDVSATPGIVTVTDVFKMRSGASVDQIPTRLPLGGGTQLQVQDESLKDIHVRGGRGGEILYVVDGMPVNHPLYGGREVLDLNVNDVDQIELLTGAFNAEYGQAQSGVVNITTRSGGAKFEAGAEYKQDMASSFSPGQENQYASMYTGGPLLPDSLGSLAFFLSANVRRSNGIFTLGRRSQDLKLFNLITLPGAARQDNTSDLNLKISWDAGEQSKFVFSHQSSWKNWTVQSGDYKWSFKNYPDSTAQYYRNTQNWNFRYTNIFSRSTIFNLNLGYLYVKYNGSPDGRRTPADFWVRAHNISGGDSLYTTAIEPRSDPATNFYDSAGIQALWRDDLTRTLTAKAELFSQVHREHFMKAGVSVQYNDLSYIDVQDGAYKLSNYGLWLNGKGPYADPPPGPFPEYGQNRWVFHTYPLIGDAYIQDKFEKESMIMNVGLRLDWLYLGKQVNDPEYKAKWQAATGIAPDWKLFKYIFSPRFGISFPITEYMVAFFSYGHFNQLPEMQAYYRDPWSGSLTGNPLMGFEKTILYEFGFTYQFAANWALDIKAYGKDLSDQVGTQQLKAASGVPVQLFVNNNYGRVRGLELELNKRYSDYFTLDLSYALQWASGYASSQYSDYVLTTLNLPQPIRERPLDWDIRHQVMLNLAIISPPGKHIDLFGLELPDDWTISILTRFSTGLTYTPGTMDPLQMRILQNASNMPYTMISDMRIEKPFRVLGGAITIFADVYNLFNRRNVISVNPWTGEPYKYGDVTGGQYDINSWSRAYAIMGPNWYSAPREIQIGLRYQL